MGYRLETYQYYRQRCTAAKSYAYAIIDFRTATRTRQPRYREIGRAIGRAMGTEDAQEIVNQINQLPRITRIRITDAIGERCGCAVCTDCRDAFVSDELNEHGVCEGCEENYSTCERCDCRTTDSLTNVEGQACCDDCRSEAYFWDSDNEYHWESEPEESELPSYGTHGCRCRRVGPEQIVGLSDVGIELEFVTDESDTIDCADSVSVASKLVCGVEQDGSLDVGGGEIVTHYGPLPYVSAEIPKICQVLRKYRAKSHDTDCCGLHVSLSCGDCTTFEIAKFVVFWNRPENAAFLKVFARRWGEFYAMPKPSLKGKLPPPDDTPKIREVLADGDRRELVNLQERRSGRLEVRAFRGSTRTETVQACVELSVLSLTYCRTSEPTLTWSDFLKWLKSSEFATHGQNLLSYYKSRKTTKESEQQCA